MKYAIAALSILTMSAFTAALAQDGQGHGPPKLTSVVFVAQAANSAQNENLTKLFRPKSVLTSLTK